MTSDPSRVQRATVERRAWWLALGGPNAISIWSWIITTALVVLVTIAYDIPTFDYRLGPRVLLVLLAQVALIPLLLLANALLTRLKSPRPLLGIGIFAVIGVARGLVVSELAPYVEPLARPGLGFQITVGVTYALLSLPFIAVVVDAIRRHRSLQASVAAAQRGWEEALRRTEQKLREEYLAYRQRVESDIATRVIMLTDELAIVAREASTSGAVHAAEELRRLSAEVVRPLSHELILDAPPARIEPTFFNPDLPFLGVRDVLKEASHNPFAGRWVPCAAMAFLGAVGLMPLTSPSFIVTNIAWDVVVFGFFPSVISLVLANRWTRLSPGAAWIASIAVWVLLALIGVAGTAILGRVLTGDAVFYWSAGAFYVLISAGTVIALAGFRRLRALDDELVSFLAEQEDRATDLMARMERDRRHLGQVLHGSVQSSLTSAALRLEQWSVTMDSAELPRVITEVRTALESALAAVEVGTATSGSLSEVVLERVALWFGAVETSVQISEDAGIVDEPFLVEQVGDIVGEAMTNAVRHGHAEQISITIARLGSSLDVVVSDDGEGPSVQQTAGGGLGHLLRSGYAWTLEREGPLTVLRVQIPIVAKAVMETEQRADTRPGSP